MYFVFLSIIYSRKGICSCHNKKKIGKGCIILVKYFQIDSLRPINVNDFEKNNGILPTEQCLGSWVIQVNQLFWRENLTLNWLTMYTANTETKLACFWWSSTVRLWHREYRRCPKAEFCTTLMCSGETSQTELRVVPELGELPRNTSRSTSIYKIHLPQNACLWCVK